MLWSLCFSLISLQQTSTRANGVLSSLESRSLCTPRQKTEHNSSSGECVMKPMQLVCWDELLWGTVWIYFSTTTHDIRPTAGVECDGLQRINTSKLYQNWIFWLTMKINVYTHIQINSETIHRQSTTYLISPQYPISLICNVSTVCIYISISFNLKTLNERNTVQKNTAPIIHESMNATDLN